MSDAPDSAKSKVFCDARAPPVSPEPDITHCNIPLVDELGQRVAVWALTEVTLASVVGDRSHLGSGRRRGSSAMRRTCDVVVPARDRLPRPTDHPGCGLVVINKATLIAVGLAGNPACC